MSEQNPPLVTRAPKDPENASEKPENERAIYQGQREHELELNRATAAYEHAIVSPLFLLNGGSRRRLPHLAWYGDQEGVDA